jgi:hypothetical protein
MNFDAYVYEPSPPASTVNRVRAWCRTQTAYHTCDGPTAEAVRAALQQELGPGVTVTWHEGAPPPPKPMGGNAPADAPAIEGDSVVSYKKLAQAFHPDMLPKRRKFSATEVMQIINELRDTARVK